MNRTILYYPTIDIPNKSWLRHAILYWDEVSSIVPNSHDLRLLNELSPEIHYLTEVGQFRPIKPEDLFEKSENWEPFQQFTLEFTKTISSIEFKKLINTRYRTESRINIRKLRSQNVARIHNNKITNNIFNILEEQGLAARNPDQFDWVFFERNTALLYMSLLAKYLADVDSEQTTIGTDLRVYEKLNFKRVKEKEGFPVVSLSLNNILPTPTDNIPLEKLIDFKRRREQNLIQFRKHLSEFQVKLSKSSSQTELKEVVTSFKHGLVAGVKDLKDVLDDSKIESNFKTFKSLINLSSPTTIVATATLLNNKFNVIDLPVSFATLGIITVGAIQLTGDFIELRNKERAALRESPFSYIYQAQKYGFVKKY
jgi:hypothetical protein